MHKDRFCYIFELGSSSIFFMIVLADEDGLLRYDLIGTREFFGLFNGNNVKTFDLA